MAWSALLRTWDKKHKTYHTVIMRIEDTPEPGCLLRLYDGDTVAGEALADTPQLAMAKALDLARAYLKDSSITEGSISWVQVR